LAFVSIKLKLSMIIVLGSKILDTLPPSHLAVNFVFGNTTHFETLQKRVGHIFRSTAVLFPKSHLL